MNSAASFTHLRILCNHFSSRAMSSSVRRVAASAAACDSIRMRTANKSSKIACAFPSFAMMMASNFGFNRSQFSRGAICVDLPWLRKTKPIPTISWIPSRTTVRLTSNIFANSASLGIFVPGCIPSSMIMRVRSLANI